MAGLEPEFQPVVNYLLPHIISHKHETHDMHLQVNTNSLPAFCQYYLSLVLVISNTSYFIVAARLNKQAACFSASIGGMELAILMVGVT